MCLILLFEVAPTWGLLSDPRDHRPPPLTRLPGVAVWKNPGRRWWRGASMAQIESAPGAMERPSDMDPAGTNRLTDEGLITYANSNTISGCDSVKSGRPSSISQHNPSNFTVETGHKFWCNQAMSDFLKDLVGNSMPTLRPTNSPQQWENLHLIGDSWLGTWKPWQPWRTWLLPWVYAYIIFTACCNLWL